MQTLLAYSKERGNWPLIFIVYFLITIITLAFSMTRPATPTVEVAADCSSEQQTIAALKQQLATIASVNGTLVVGGGAPRPSSKADCPDCPPCPEVRLKFEAKAENNGKTDTTATNTQDGAATAVAKVEDKGLSFAIDLGASLPIYDGADFTADLKAADIEISAPYGRVALEARWRPQDNEVRIGPRVRIFGR